MARQSVGAPAAGSRRSRSSRLTIKLAASSAAGLALLGGFLVGSAGSAQAATAVGLGAADSFAVLAGSGITNTGATTITGDLGTFPTTTITDAGALTINGVNRGGDAVTQGAKTDLVTAYNAAAGQGPPSPIVADLGGTTLVPGVYNSATSIGLTGTVTLDAGGDTSAVFVFQAGSTLTTAAASRVLLTNGAQSCNVFWQLGSSGTIGTGTAFVGTIIAMTSITVTTGATIDGRALARDGAVTLDTNVITRSQCSTAPASVVPYAANIGPGAQGLVCPWGGQFDGFGLCSGTGFSTLANPSATPAPSATSAPSPTSSPSAVPSPVASSTGGVVARPSPHPVTIGRPVGPIQPPQHRPDSGPQVPQKPSGGVDTGDDSTG